MLRDHAKILSNRTRLCQASDEVENGTRQSLINYEDSENSVHDYWCTIEEHAASVCQSPDRGLCLVKGAVVALSYTS